MLMVRDSTVGRALALVMAAAGATMMDRAMGMAQALLAKAMHVGRVTVIATATAMATDPMAAEKVRGMARGMEAEMAMANGRSDC